MDTKSLQLPIIDLASSDRISTVHSIRQMAFFLDPNPACVVERLKTCCSASSPPRFLPIRCGDYLKERFKLLYGS